MKRKTLRALLASTAAGVVLVGMANTASAHAISIGYENAGPGAVTVWLGSYHTDHNLEGSMKLEGVSGTVFGPTTLAFTTLVTTKPGALVDGTNNFYASGSMEGTGPLTPTNTLGSGYSVVYEWEGITFSGLSAGDYQFTYVPIANPTVEWHPWTTQLNGTFDLSGVVQPTPEPTSMALFGLGALGLGCVRRRRRSGTPVEEEGIV